MGEEGPVDTLLHHQSGPEPRAPDRRRPRDRRDRPLAVEPGLKKPFFLLTHLDSSHFYYVFHEAKPAVRPNAEAVTTRRLLERSPASRELLFNRYQNAVAHDDSTSAGPRGGESGRPIRRHRGRHHRGPRTSFDPGMVGHLQVSEPPNHSPADAATRRARRSRVEPLTTEADACRRRDPSGPPTRPQRRLGAGAVGPPRRSVLTLEAAMRQAHLTFLSSRCVRPGIQRGAAALVLADPSLGRDGAPLPGWRELLAPSPGRANSSRPQRDAEP